MYIYVEVAMSFFLKANWTHRREAGPGTKASISGRFTQPTAAGLFAASFSGGPSGKQLDEVGLVF